MWSRRRVSALLCTIVAPTTAISSTNAVGASEPIRFGVSLGLTGQYQQPSLMHQRAYELWRDEVNARDGIMGRPVEFIILDDRSDPDEAKRIYGDFVASGSVHHVFAPYSSELTFAVAPIVDAAGFPMLAAGAAADDIWQKGYLNVFGILTPASRYTQGMLRLAHEAGLTTVAILHSEDPFSTQIADGTRKWAPYLKFKILVDAGISRDATSLAAEARTARDAGAELVIVAGYFKEAVLARQALIDLGWEPRAYFATIGPALSDWQTKFGRNADHTFATSLWETSDTFAYPGSREFAAAFKSRYGIEASYHAAAAYAAGQLFEASVTTAHSIDHDAVRAAILGLDTYTVLGRFAVDHKGMQLKFLDMIIQWQNGRKEIVWPEQLRTTLPVFGKQLP